MYKVEMKMPSEGWVTLGGIFPGDIVSERITQFEQHFMTRSSKGGPPVCTRQFRMVPVR